MNAGDVVWLVEDYDGQVDVVKRTVSRVSGDLVVFDHPYGGHSSEYVQHAYRSERAAWDSVVRRMERDAEHYRAIRDALPAEAP